VSPYKKEVQKIQIKSPPLFLVFLFFLLLLLYSKMTSSNLAFELFTLPTQVDNGAFWNNLKENHFFILQQAKSQKSGIMRSVLGTLQNV
jgi:hypothetical protein